MHLNTPKQKFSYDTGVNIAISTIQDGNMHPNLEHETEREKAQERFNSFCFRHGFDPFTSAGMRVDPNLEGIAQIARTSILGEHELGTVDPQARHSAIGLISDTGAPLFTIVGDCYPVIAVPDSNEFALLHVNWRAIEAGLGSLALDALGSKAESTKFYIGPGIRTDFNWHSALNLPRQASDPRWRQYVDAFAQHPITRERGITINLLGKLLDDLKNIGVPEENMYVDPGTTADPNYYSKRGTRFGVDKPRGNGILIAGKD